MSLTFERIFEIVDTNDNSIKTEIKEILNIFLDANNDWPIKVMSVEEYKNSVQHFIKAIPDEATIKQALKSIDILYNAWKVESLSTLLEVFKFYPQGISLVEIIEDIKLQLNRS